MVLLNLPEEPVTKVLMCFYFMRVTTFLKNTLPDNGHKLIPKLRADRNFFCANVDMIVLNLDQLSGINDIRIMHTHKVVW